MKQPSLTARRQSTMRRLTEGVIKGLLQFKLTHDLTAYEIERLRSNWRDVEVELHTNYPLSESGIVAVLENNRVRGLDEEEFFLTDEPIAPEDTVSLLGSFPLNAA